MAPFCVCCYFYFFIYITLHCSSCTIQHIKVNVVEVGWLADSVDSEPYVSAFSDLEPPLPGVATRNELVIPPKVFSDYESSPGEAPRPLLVERKRREYAAKLTKLPELVFTRASPGTLGAESMLALEHFDDDSFDIRTPEEWIKLGGGDKCKLPAVALCCSTYPRDQVDLVFEEVTVTGYNPVTMKFTVERKLEMKQPTSEKEKNRAKTLGILYDRVLELHRLFVCFTVEDPEKFAERVSRAHSSRYQSELTIRCQLYVDCMPTDGLWDLEQDIMSSARVLKLATTESPHASIHGKQVVDLTNVVGNELIQNQAAQAVKEELREKRREYSLLLLKEASEDYARSMAAIVLRSQGAAHVPGFQELVGFGGRTVGGPPAETSTTTATTTMGKNNTICRPRPKDLPKLDLHAVRANFDLVTSLNIPEAVDALQMACCTTFDICRQRNFFLSRDPRRSQGLSEFQDAQERHMDDEILALRQWPHDVCEASKSIAFFFFFFFFFPS
jgi:hypothetical protein